mmetsp:Transcript_17518/g.28360  ORF Transcript_17518/g.28360 Transcript_17518/m.28360 type:complete len:175 (+) Transcript_17518:90-614(+)
MEKSCKMKAYKYKSSGASKYEAIDTKDFGKSLLKEGEELWVVRVPGDFDVGDMDGCVLSREGTSRFSNANGETFACKSQVVASQVHCFARSKSHTNGLKLGPLVARTFDVTEYDPDESYISDSEDTKRKVEEIVDLLKSTKRKQIKFTTCYTHLGEEPAKKKKKTKKKKTKTKE